MSGYMVGVLESTLGWIDAPKIYPLLGKVITASQPTSRKRIFEVITTHRQETDHFLIKSNSNETGMEKNGWKRIQCSCAKASTAPLVGFESRLFCSLLLRVHQKTSQKPTANSQNTPCLLNMHQREKKGRPKNQTQKNTTQKHASLSLSPSARICAML